MKATLEFNLDDPDDDMAHLRCVKALDMALALWQIRHNMRKSCEQTIEFGLRETASAYDGMEVVFKELNQVFEEHGLIMEELLS